jgi:predicted secreted acid phosphatase
MSRILVAAVAALSLLAFAVAGAGAKEPKAPATPAAIRAYHDSGEWAKDTKAQLKKATADLKKALKKKKGAKAPKGKATLVLDIDDTSLSTYDCQNKKDFANATSACVLGGGLPAIKGTLALAKLAIKNHVKLAFITGRPDLGTIREGTETNLKAAGFTMKHTLTLLPAAQFPAKTLVPYKTGARKALEKAGARIVLNVGDQKSDLAGGHAKYAVKLPNPMYFTP